MATKAQIIEFIVDNFTEMDGSPVSKSKLDNYRKADLEMFIKQNGAETELKAWVATL